MILLNLTVVGDSPSSFVGTWTSRGRWETIEWKRDNTRGRCKKLRARSFREEGGSKSVIQWGSEDHVRTGMTGGGITIRASQANPIRDRAHSSRPDHWWLKRPQCYQPELPKQQYVPCNMVTKQPQQSQGKNFTSFQEGHLSLPGILTKRGQ